MPETTRVQSRLWRIYRRLDPSLLTTGDPGPSADLGLGHLEGRVGLALGTYTREGIENALRAYGTLDRMEALGLGPLEVQLQLTDPFQPRITILSGAHGGRACLDVELRAAGGAAVGLPDALGRVSVIYLESLLLQHPGRRFDWSRPPLPEQEFPGLSMASEIVQLLLLLAKRVGAEALVLRPSTFHAASAYARYLRFVDGRAQGRFEGLRGDAQLRPLWLLSWALELGCVRRDGEPVQFTPDPMAAPLSHRVARHFARPAWKRARARGRAERHLLDTTCLRERFPWNRMPKGPSPASVRTLLRGPRR